MQLAGVLAVSPDVRDIAEIVASALVGLACLYLVVSGFRARRKAKGTKGNLRLVGGFALLLLVGLSIYGPVSSSTEKEPAATATAPMTTPTVEQAKKFETCDEADVEFDRLYDQLLERGSDGDVAGMTATAETQFQTTTLNPECISQRGTTAASEVLTRLKSDPLPAAVAQQVSEPCRPVIRDAVRLLNTATLRKFAGDEDGANTLGEGFEKLGALNRKCMPSVVVKDFKLQLEQSPLGSASTQQTP